jgi:putative tributyrin esterase
MKENYAIMNSLLFRTKMRFFIIFILLYISTGIVNAEKDTILYITETKVEIIYPTQSPIGTILVLPGWNYPQDDICKKSNFCNLAMKKGYILILPDMQKSIYHTSRYPETRTDWLKYHTAKWLTDTVVPKLQKDLNLLKPGSNNYLFGISTGGRGVAIMAINMKNLFVAGASLSGDFDQTLDQSDNLIRGYYGEYSKFPERWVGDDNPNKNASKVNIRLYLSHGNNDKVVDPKQTIDFYNSLIKSSSTNGHILNIVKDAGHNYLFWSAEYDAIFNFFETHK